MPTLSSFLELSRCPHCGVDSPTLSKRAEVETHDFRKTRRRVWFFYGCNKCGGIVTAAAPNPQQAVSEVYPSATAVDESIPERAKEFLTQALNSLSAPSGAVMLAASAVDAMLKAKGLTKGSLYARIDEAARSHLITGDMAAWAHDVRLDANAFWVRAYQCRPYYLQRWTLCLQLNIPCSSSHQIPRLPSGATWTSLSSSLCSKPAPYFLRARTSLETRSRVPSLVAMRCCVQSSTRSCMRRSRLRCWRKCKPIELISRSGSVSGPSSTVGT